MKRPVKASTKSVLELTLDLCLLVCKTGKCSNWGKKKHQYDLGLSLNNNSENCKYKPVSNGSNIVSNQEMYNRGCTIA